MTWMVRRMSAGARAYLFGRRRTRRIWRVAPIRREVLKLRSARRPCGCQIFGGGRGGAHTPMSSLSLEVLVIGRAVTGGIKLWKDISFCNTVESLQIFCKVSRVI